MGIKKEKAATFPFDNTLCPKYKAILMIILYPKNFNENFSDILKMYEVSDFIVGLKCPHCASGDLIKWGSYTRTLYYGNENALKCKIINIKRVKCKECCKTHSLLPSFIVPYKIHALDVILTCLSSNNDFLSVSFDTISRWNGQFNKFLPYLKTMFNNLSKIYIILKFKENILMYYKQYFDNNKKVLMMVRPGIYDMVPF